MDAKTRPSSVFPLPLAALLLCLLTAGLALAGLSWPAAGASMLAAAAAAGGLRRRPPLAAPEPLPAAPVSLAETSPPAEPAPAAPPVAQPDPLARTALTEARVLLPMARAVVDAVPAKTEEAAFVLMEKFEKVQQSTAKLASVAREAKTAATASTTSVAERTRAAIHAERAAIQDIATQNRENAGRLRSIGKEMEAGIELLRSIEEITERSHVIAINMAIEAARLGERGQGFRVINSELRSLNDRTADFSRRISALLGGFRDFNAVLIQDMTQRNDQTIDEVGRGMRAAEEAVESLIDASLSTEALSEQIFALVELIDRDMEGVLESLQFQDYTRQMIESSSAMLRRITEKLKELDSLGALPSETSEPHVREAIRKSLMDKATTRAEREALAEVKA